MISSYILYVLVKPENPSSLSTIRQKFDMQQLDNYQQEGKLIIMCCECTTIQMFGVT